MKKETQADLILNKFLKSNNEAQQKLFNYILSNGSPDLDMITDVLNNKKLCLESKNVTEGDWIYLDLDNYNGWQTINKSYYEENNLLINDKYIKVKVLYINPLNHYVNLKLRIGDKFEGIEIYQSYIMDQSKIQEIIAE